jgi:hypothetical protein
MYKPVILKNFRLSGTMSAVAVATSVVGLFLLCVAWWLRPIAAAERALASGDLDRAVQEYTVGRDRLDWIPYGQNLFPGLDDLVMANQLSLQYALRRYDRILEDAGAKTVRGPAAFWAGCALFDKALVEVDPEVRVRLMSDAHQSFRRALELAPGDWDSKFNYEVTGRFLSILHEQPQTPTQEIMKILRERGPRPRGGPRTG